jgi:hypothetical protein
MNTSRKLSVSTLRIFCLSVMAISARYASANQVLEQSLETRLKDADVVVIARVSSMLQADHNGFEATLSVESTLKGTANTTIRLVDGDIPELTPHCCTVGTRYLLFLTRLGSGAYRSFDGPFGVYELDADPPAALR